MSIDSRMDKEVMVLIYNETLLSHGASQVAQWQRICLLLHEMKESQFQFLGWEDSLE